MSDQLVAERRGRVLTLTLDRPATRNALSAELVEDLIAQFDALTPATTDLVVLRGAGPTFSAGFDLGALDEQSDGDLARRFVRIEQLLQAVHHAPCDTMALAHGRVFGAAADLVCACTHRVATPDASFRFPGLAFGIVLGTRRLASRIGVDAARHVQGTGAVLTAARAAELGLLTHVAGTGEWDDLQRQVTEAVAAIPEKARAVFRRALTTDHQDADLADLARSACVPGLRKRIESFRSR